jgi:hypothetical protein
VPDGRLRERAQYLYARALAAPFGDPSGVVIGEVLTVSGFDF